MAKENGEPHRSLADFIAPRRVGDHIAAFAVTSGIGLDELVKKFKAEHDDYNAIMAEALADRLAEAFAECLHKRVRDEWGFGKSEQLSTRRPHRGKIPRHPPCAGLSGLSRPHGETHALGAARCGEATRASSSPRAIAMWPGSSVSGFYFAHPESRYFAVGKLGKDQVADYAKRKGMSLAEAERWLGPWLNYTPGA